MIVAARSQMVETGRLPSGVKSFFENIELHGNPYGLSRSKRGGWAAESEAEQYNGHEYLLYAGCTGSYDTRAQKSTLSLAHILRKANVSFGILGVEENCDGNEVYKLGETGLFETLVEENVALFKGLGVRNIITLSPHAYNVFKNHYPEYGGDFTVFHYTQILCDLIKTEKLNFPNNFQSKITYHDPCFLGRWNNEYEAPREILRSMPGIELLEMEKNRDGALCCGGGAGNFQIDLLGGSKDSPSRRRVREAATAGADILAVACPKCLVMLEDALKSEELEGILSVMDISEIAARICGIQQR
jgi:Fe-S oxidoreductase